MVATSELYDTTIQMDSRSFVCRVTVGADTLTSEVNRFVQTLGSCGADSFTVGCVFASYVDITLSAASVPLAGRELYVEMGLCLPGGTVEYVPMGYYTAFPPDIEKTRGRVTVKAADRLSSKCGGLYAPSVAFPASIGQLLDDIETQAGISVETVLDVSGTVTEPVEGLLYREALGYIAGLLGGFCYADRYGVIRIAAYPGSRTAEVGAGRCLDDAQMAEDSYTVGSLAVTVKAGGTDADGNEDAGVSYAEGSGEGISVSNPYMTRELFDAMKGRVLGYTYRPGTVRFLGDPRIGPEDALEVTDWAGDKYLLPGMAITHDYDGGLTTTVTAPGRAVSDMSARGPLQSAMDRLLADMVLTKEVVAKKITADDAVLRFASIDSLRASNARIDTISGDLASYQAVVAGDLAALTARIEKIVSTDITVEYLEANYAAVDMANVTHGSIKNYHIGDGQIGSAQIADASITDAKIVELTANKINAGTLSVERLEIRGSANSLVYALNDISGALQAQNVDTLNGEVLTPRTITADRLVARSITAEEIAAGTITANEINVANLFAQDIEATGTIRGLHIVGATGDFSGTVNATDGVFRGTVYASAGEFTGKVTATSGMIGGWEIGDGYMRSKDSNNRYVGVGVSGKAFAFYAGGTAANGSDGVFRVGHGGELLATNAVISGKIVGETIDIKATTQTASMGEWKAMITANSEHGLFLGYEQGNHDGSITMAGGNIVIEDDNRVAITSLQTVSVTGFDVYIRADNGLVIDGGMVSTGNITCEKRIYVSDWVYSVGSAGLYWQKHGGGWYMSDSSWIRAYANKGIYTTGVVYGGQVNVGTSAATAYLNIGNNNALIYAQSGDGNIYFRYRTSISASYSYANIKDIVAAPNGKLSLTGGTMTGNINFANGHGPYNSSNGGYLIRDNGTLTGVGNTVRKTGIWSSDGSLHWKDTSTTFTKSGSSDRRVKRDIQKLTDRYKAFYMSVVPYSFCYMIDDDDRTHIGYMAQDVAAAVEKYGLPADNGLWEATEPMGDALRYVDAGDRLLRVNYLEWVPLNTYMVQRVYRGLTALTEEVAAWHGDMGARQDSAEARISALQAQLADATAKAARQETEIQLLKTRLEQLQAA